MNVDAPDKSAKNFVYCLMPPLSIFGGYHLAPTAILDFQDGRHHNIINTNISASKKLFFGSKNTFSRSTNSIMPFTKVSDG